MLSGVPKMSARNADAARRFTWLVDVFYDDRVKLVVSSEAEPEALFTEGENSAEFERTVSRLHEMQSAAYRQSERRRSGSAEGQPAGQVPGVPADGGR
jgi:cell division protein ZapE